MANNFSLGDFALQSSTLTQSVSGTHDIDWRYESYHDLTLTGNTTLTESNVPPSGQGRTIVLRITGDFTLTVPSSWNVDVSGYDGTGTNLITVASFGTSEHFGAINTVTS